jgi:hypothetical protein
VEILRKSTVTMPTASDPAAQPTADTAISVAAAVERRARAGV